MKTLSIACSALLAATVGGLGQTGLEGGVDQTAGIDRSAAPTSEYRITERGPHHRTVQRTLWETAPDGTRIPHVVSYVELASGMHYQEAGEWRDSDPSFEVGTDGFALASRGQARVRVAPNINRPEGVVELTLPNGQTLRSAILGLNLGC